MGIGRLAPHRVRAKYARALSEIPLPVRSFAGIDPGALTILGEAEIAGRCLKFGILESLPRMWAVLGDEVPEGEETPPEPKNLAARDRIPPTVLGFLTGFDTDRPELHITELDYLEWARQSGRAARIKREATAIWQAAQRECDG
ncbi:hypothetical protein [Glycomyces sp. NRRL B-16210]|uniref:hypothetical protein n=1 Tax=Glycomyces sp. NRRL B-16210 TaxID=1463821 RepID=UPI0004BFBB7E|nr:hypothetical protein [Glycomyces sp. NRRL B-16210]